MIRNCKYCGEEYETLINKKVFCCRNHSLAYRDKHVYGYQYTYNYRSSSPRRFMQGLANKVTKDRKLSVDFLEELYNKQNGICAISGREMTYISGKGRVPTNISIDRIDSSIGYIESNIQLACRQANLMKMELSMDELKSWCKDIYEQK